MSFCEFMGIVVVHLHFIGEKVQLGCHADDHTAQVSVHERIVLAPVVVELLDYAVTNS